MNMFQAIQCKVFKSHEWEEWRYVTASTSSNPNLCMLERNCKHCRFHEIKQGEAHAWTEWAYLRDGSCEQERVCTICQVKESRQANHKWTKWEYKPESCEQERACKICHQQETKKSDHNWTEWAYETEDSCVKARHCQRCHKEETEETHAWSDWAKSDDPHKLERSCARCHQTETKAAHVVAYAHYYGTGVCDVCNRSISPGEAYLVPTSTFYNSRKYREWLRTGPFSFMITLAGGNVDSYIAHARSIDTTPHSAVCPDCIYMFE